MANDRAEKDEKEVNGKVIDDNVFHQMQRMFSYLDYSQRREYNPVDFCLSYKDYTGQPINVMIQQDAQEFLNMIFDKLENSLKATPFKGIMESVYAGKTCNVFTCGDCGHVRTKLEMFYNLSLEVKNMKTLNDSFKKFTTPDIISDYLCDSCKKKCNLKKQCFLKELPNVMIVHLQKIIFDLETYARIKISSRYEFPQKVNLKEFMVDPALLKLNDKKTDDDDTKEVITEDDDKEDDDKEVKEVIEEEEEDEDFQYKLVGVVIHKGNADFGHYISLINVRREGTVSKEEEEDEEGDQWLEFDDWKVSRFNMKNFEEECFGNDEKDTFNTYNLLGGSEPSVSKSAYILVYDKVKKSKIHVEFSKDNEHEKELIMNHLIDPEDYQFSDNRLETSFYNIGKYIPPETKEEIDKDNAVLVLETQLLGREFTNFFIELIEQIQLPELSIYSESVPPIDKYQQSLCKALIKCLPTYFFKVFCVSNNNFKI